MQRVLSFCIAPQNWGGEASSEIERISFRKQRMMTTQTLDKTAFGPSQAAGNADTLDTQALAPWVQSLYRDTILQRRRDAAAHPFTQAVRAGEVDPRALAAFFGGMYWHVTRAGHLFGGFFARRPAAVETFLEGRSEDGHSPEDETRLQKTSLGALIDALGGDSETFAQEIVDYAPPQEWFWHEAQLRSAIFSSDFPWQVGAAAINAGTEGVVPWMCGPLADALAAGYGINGLALEWLHQRITPEEIEHGDNGFLILSHFVDETDAEQVSACRLYADKLSLSMSKHLLDCGLRLHHEMSK